MLPSSKMTIKHIVACKRLQHFINANVFNDISISTVKIFLNLSNNQVTFVTSDQTQRQWVNFTNPNGANRNCNEHSLVPFSFINKTTPNFDITHS